MADVFISYKRRMRPRVAELADALERLKISVWFDAEIEAGKSFGAVINRELDDAKCVLVCWTPDAFAPEHGDDVSWVEAEASKGRDKKILVPVLLEKAILNAPWNMLQTEDLTNWTADAAPTGAWLGTLAGVGKLVGRPGLADYARASASGLPEELTRWAQTYPEDPLAAEVWDKITELEVAAARARVAAGRAAKPAPTAPKPMPAATPRQEAAAPASAPAQSAYVAPPDRKLALWQILVLVVVFAIGGIALLFAIAIALTQGTSTTTLAAAVFYTVIGFPLVLLGWLLRRSWVRPA